MEGVHRQWTESSSQERRWDKKMRVVYNEVPGFATCLVDSYLCALSRALFSFKQSMTLLLTHLIYVLEFHKQSHLPIRGHSGKGSNIWTFPICLRP